MNQPKLYNACNVPLDIFKKSLKDHGHLLQINNEEDLTVLDIGIGDGKSSEFIIKNILPPNTTYIGCDISKEMIDYVKTVKAFRNKELVLMDICKKVPEGFKNKFDVVFALLIFHFVTDVKIALKNIYSMLKPNGIIYATFFEYTPVDYPFTSLSTIPKWKEYKSEKWCSLFYKTKTREEIKEYYESVMDQIGFKYTVYHRDVFSNEYDFVEFKKCVIGVNPTVTEVNEKNRNDYIKDYLNFYFQQNCVEVKGENVTFTYPIVTLQAKK